MRKWVIYAWRALASLLLAIGLLSAVMSMVAEWYGAEVVSGGAAQVVGVGFGEGYYTYFSWTSDDLRFLTQVAPAGWSANAGGPLTPIAYRLPGVGTRESFSLGGFVFARTRMTQAGTNHKIGYMQLPCWMLALAGVPVLPWWILVLFRRYGRREPGRCHKCGYDMRATPERCPECGTAMSGK